MPLSRFRDNLNYNPSFKNSTCNTKIIILTQPPHSQAFHANFFKNFSQVYTIKLVMISYQGKNGGGDVVFDKTVFY